MDQVKLPYKELSSLPFWNDLNPDERQYLISNLVYLQYQQGQQLLNANTQCLGVLLVLKGILRTYLLSPNGREMTLYRTRAGETYLLMASCVLDTISFDTQVEAEEDCELLLVPSSIYSQLVAGNVNVECSSYKLLIEGYSDVVSSIERLVFMNLEQRLASFLLDEAVSSSSTTITMTHEQLAANIGSARVAVSRTLKDMEKQKLVALTRGEILIKNMSGLYQLIQ